MQNNIEGIPKWAMHPKLAWEIVRDELISAMDHNTYYITKRPMLEAAIEITEKAHKEVSEFQMDHLTIDGKCIFNKSKKRKKE